MTLILFSYRQIGFAFRRIFELKNLPCHLRRPQRVRSGFCQFLSRRIVFDHVHHYSHLFHRVFCRLDPLLMMILAYLCSHFDEISAGVLKIFNTPLRDLLY